MAKKIYLSGKISGDPNFKEKFAQKAKELTEQGHLVFNPALHPDMFTWEQFMELDLKALANCDSIYLLDDWKDSRGAKIEYDEALRLGKEVLFEEKKEIDNSIKAEIQEYKSFKFRVTLEDGSQTPWQYSDHNPSKNDLEDVKKFYTNLTEKKKFEQSEILQDYKKKGIKFSSSAPSKTAIGYKVFYVKDGKLYPPMVKNPGGSDTPMNLWLDASAGEISSYTKTGRPQIEKGGEGTHCSKGELAYRPDWHLGDVPIAKQFEKVNPLNGKKELFPREFVWAECEYSCDIDYQEDAMKNGYTENGSFRHSYAGLQKVPENGCYRYRTNPDPNTEEWIITGKIKVNRILSGKEVDELCRKAGKEPQKREKTFEELESLLVKSLSRDVYDYTPFRNEEEAELHRVEREKDMVKRIEHELDKNKLFHDKDFLSSMNRKYENIQSMASYYSKIVKDNLVRTRVFER